MFLIRSTRSAYAIIFLMAQVAGVYTDWVDYNGGEYMFVSEPASWYDALIYCEEQDGKLAEPHDADEQKWIADTAASLNMRTPWLGFIGAGNKKFVLSDGTALSYEAWGPEEPNNHGGYEDCVHLSEYDQLWNDIRCYMKFEFVCKKDPTPNIGCKVDPKGTTYAGNVMETKTGIGCQRWDSQEPHTHNIDIYDGANNYCRNPGGQLGPWCYTTDPVARWAYCDVPLCPKSGVIPNVDCKVDTVGLSYFGKINETGQGQTCISWTSSRFLLPLFPDSSMEDSGNHCRNPDTSGKPWCYHGAGLWQYCDIPECFP